VISGAAQPQARSGVVYYVDASYFIFRAYHSMPADMVDGDGNATHALYGFARFVSDLLEQIRPERIGVAFDVSLRSETSFRNGIYPAYKANRESPPADLERQFALCREFCRHMGLAEFASATYEADDIIGTLAARSRAAGLRNVLVTRD
jgi:5'-3' exonuclease